jgi:hypothetical protein
MRGEDNFVVIKKPSNEMDYTEALASRIEKHSIKVLLQAFKEGTINHHFDYW